MVEYDQPTLDTRALKEELLKCGVSMNIDDLKSQLDALTREQHADGFWDNLDNAQVVNKKISVIENKLNRYTKLLSRIDDTLVLIEMCDEGQDLSELDNILREIGGLTKDIASLRLETLLRGKYDYCNAILTLHAGAGGTEAQDWTDMLYRMYIHYAEKHNYQVNVLDKLDGDEAGIKSITFSICGDNAYGYLKAEKGVHRLVRISPFDANKRRHTSFASLEVMPEIDTDIDIKIKPEDLKVDTYRSSGAGGQHVNKTESAIRITHLPTGIVVNCQNERSQVQNREQAMKMLMSKLVEKAEQEQLEQAQEIKGELKKIEWGSQIRSYVFQPYTMVKDHRTGYETGNITAVMDGEIDEFITEYLAKS